MNEALSKWVECVTSIIMRDQSVSLESKQELGEKAYVFLSAAVPAPQQPAADAGDVWQPIETKPADTPILVYAPPLRSEASGLQMVAVWLLEPYPHWKGRDWLEPTHWQPLPKGPRQ